MTQKKRIPSEAEPPPWKSPFAALKDVQLGEALKASRPSPSIAPILTAPKKDRGRVEVQRQTAHRGGKTVTVISGFVGIGQTEKERLAKEMQKSCGTGGTVKEGRIEIQGDHRKQVARILTEAGFRPVMSGG
ncbi:MAG TPA: translation initiation factor [Nitrospiraceae bacterium]|nr:translation initiation factor [Nitrospiraceae bacterium]